MNYLVQQLPIAASLATLFFSVPCRRHFSTSQNMGTTENFVSFGSQEFHQYMIKVCATAVFTTVMFHCSIVVHVVVDCSYRFITFLRKEIRVTAGQIMSVYGSLCTSYSIKCRRNCHLVYIFVWTCFYRCNVCIVSTVLCICELWCMTVSNRNLYAYNCRTCIHRLTVM